MTRARNLSRHLFVPLQVVSEVVIKLTGILRGVSVDRPIDVSGLSFVSDESGGERASDEGSFFLHSFLPPSAKATSTNFIASAVMEHFVTSNFFSQLYYATIPQTTFCIFCCSGYERSAVI